MKFLRDTMIYRDIDGACARKPGVLAYDKVYDEIEGSKVKKLFVANDGKSSLDVKDINGYK